MVASTLVQCAVAQTTPKEPATPVDIPIPESPAAAAVGNTGTVLRPSTVREFAASLGSTVSRSGKVKPLVAIEISPYLLITRGMPINGYASGVNLTKSREAGRTVLEPLPLSWQWTMANTSLSFATGAKDSGDFAKRSAVGLKVPLFDSGDPRLNFAYSKCIAELDAKLAVPVMTGDPGAVDKSAERVKGEAACATKAGDVAWNGSAAALAMAQTYVDRGTDQKADMRKDARQFWASYAWGYNVGKAEAGQGAGQVVLQYKHVRDAIDTEAAELGSAAATANVRYNANTGHLKWRFGSAKANFDVSATDQRRKYVDGKRDKVRTLAVGAEMKFGDYWVLLQYGREQSDVAGNKPFALVNLKHAFGKEPNLTPE